MQQRAAIGIRGGATAEGMEPLYMGRLFYQMSEKKHPV